MGLIRAFLSLRKHLQWKTRGRLQLGQKRCYGHAIKRWQRSGMKITLCTALGGKVRTTSIRCCNRSRQVLTCLTSAAAPGGTSLRFIGTVSGRSGRTFRERHWRCSTLDTRASFRTFVSFPFRTEASTLSRVMGCSGISPELGERRQWGSYFGF